MQQPERSIVFAAFNRAPNAEEMVPKFSAMAAHPLLGERAGVREDHLSSTTMKRCALTHRGNKKRLPDSGRAGVMRKSAGR